MRSRLVKTLIICLVGMVLVCVSTTACADIARIAAAANLYYALPEVVQLFERSTGDKISITFGSSGNLVRQIKQGAPFEVFFSADEAYAARLAGSSFAEDNGYIYAIGRLVLFAPKASRVPLTEDLSGIDESLLNGQLKRLAIANPEHAPYGAAAKDALQTAGIWQDIAPRLIIGENVAQATQFAVSGSVEAAIIPYSSVMIDTVANRGRYTLISDDLYAPLRQRAILLRGAGDVARRFYHFVARPDSKKILQRHGLGLSDSVTAE